ncbi:soluble scavenger receptor cysteine-rich domain-containing protein SSC5D-like [Coturnix japonica]|nr:soluble scavenger receptor cysteine-rich domain-containing protein SSC5D-like [Coturnix japonica]
MDPRTHGGPRKSQRVPTIPNGSQTTQGSLWVSAHLSQIPNGSQKVPEHAVGDSGSWWCWWPHNQCHSLVPFPLRLSGGPGRCVGRVELLHNGSWGTICDDDWGLPDAAVVCRQLGCGTALAAPSGAWFGEGSGPIWLNHVRCSGDEQRLAQCRHRGWHSHVCTHEEDASVVCSAHPLLSPGTTEPSGTAGSTTMGGSVPAVMWMPYSPAPHPLRLVGGPGRCAGRVELLHSGIWGTVCDDGWGLPDATVVCRQLGCGAALVAHGGAFFGEGTGPIWMDNVRCWGNESALLQCPAAPLGITDCRHREDASVICADELTGVDPMPPTPEQLPTRSLLVSPSAVPRVGARPCSTSSPQLTPSSRPTDATSQMAPFLLRLAGGPGRCAGRVELLRAGSWGTVCDDSWGLLDAHVVCRQLGCGAARKALRSAHFGPGIGPIWLDEVKCSGTEAALWRCPAEPWGKHNCDHGEDAAVICAGPEDLSPVGTSPSPSGWDPASSIPQRPLGRILATIIPTRPQRQDPAVGVTRTTAQATGRDPFTSVPRTTMGSAGQGRVSATSTKAGRDPIRIIRITRLKAEQDPAGIIQSTKPKAAGVTRLKAGREHGGPNRSKVEWDPAGTNRSKVGRDSVSINKTKVRLDPAGTNRSKVGQDSVSINKTKVRLDPAGTNRSKVGRESLGINKVKAGQHLVSINKTKAGRDPVGINKTKTGRDPVGINKTKTGRDPVGINKTKAGQDPVGINKTKAGRDPVGINKTKAGRDPVGTNRSRAGWDPSGTIHVTRHKIGWDPHSTTWITHPKAEQVVVGANQSTRHLVWTTPGTKPQAEPAPVDSTRSTQGLAGQDAVSAIQSNVEQEIVGVTQSSRSNAEQDSALTVRLQASAVKWNNHSLGEPGPGSPMGSTLPVVDSEGTMKSAAPTAEPSLEWTSWVSHPSVELGSEGPVRSTQRAAELGPESTVWSMYPTAEPVPEGTMKSTDTITELGPEGTVDVHPLTELDQDVNMGGARTSVEPDPRGAMNSTGPTAGLYPDDIMRSTRPTTELGPDPSTYPAAEPGPEGTMKSTGPTAELVLEGTTAELDPDVTLKFTHPAAELDPDVTMRHTSPAAELGPDVTTRNTHPAVELGPDVPMRSTTPAGELAPDVTMWSTSPATELDPDITMRNTRPAIELDPDVTMRGAHPAVELGPDVPMRNTRPATELGPDVTMKSTTPAAELGPDVTMWSTTPAIELDPDVTMRSTHPATELGPDVTMKSTSPAAELDPDITMRSTTPAIELDPDVTMRSTRPAAELGPDITMWSTTPAIELGPDVTMRSTSPATELDPDITMRNTRPAIELDPDVTIRSAHPAAELNPDVTMRSTTPATELGPDVPMKGAHPAAELDPESTAWTTHLPEEMDPDGATQSAHSSAELSLGARIWGTYPTADVSTWSTHPAPESGLEVTTWDTHSSADFDLHGTTRSKHSSAEANLKDTMETEHIAIETSLRDATWRTHPTEERASDGIMRRTLPTAESGAGPIEISAVPTRVSSPSPSLGPTQGLAVSPVLAVQLSPGYGTHSQHPTKAPSTQGPPEPTQYPDISNTQGPPASIQHPAESPTAWKELLLSQPASAEPSGFQTHPDLFIQTPTRNPSPQSLPALTALPLDPTSSYMNAAHFKHLMNIPRPQSPSEDPIGTLSTQKAPVSAQHPTETLSSKSPPALSQYLTEILSTQVSPAPNQHPMETSDSQPPPAPTEQSMEIFSTQRPLVSPQHSTGGPPNTQRPPSTLRHPIKTFGTQNPPASHKHPMKLLSTRTPPVSHQHAKEPLSTQTPPGPLKHFTDPPSTQIPSAPVQHPVETFGTQTPQAPLQHPMKLFSTQTPPAPTETLRTHSASPVLPGPPCAGPAQPALPVPTLSALWDRGGPCVAPALRALLWEVRGLRGQLKALARNQRQGAQRLEAIARRLGRLAALGQHFLEEPTWQYGGVGIRRGALHRRQGKGGPSSWGGPAGSMGGLHSIGLCLALCCGAVMGSVPARLSGSHSQCQGRVELLQAGTWASVCAVGWDLAAARVLCRQLGCGRPRAVPLPCSPTKAEGDVVGLRQVLCAGQELDLEHCELQPGDAVSCPSKHVAAVNCEEPFRLRLADGPRRCAGRLEVQRAGRWGTVCDDGWSRTNAAVVCQELGCGEAQGLDGERPRFKPGVGRIWLDDVRCRGQEKSLQDCAHRVWGYHDCTHHEDVGVVCQDP